MQYLYSAALQLSVHWKGEIRKGELHSKKKIHLEARNQVLSLKVSLLLCCVQTRENVIWYSDQGTAADIIYLPVLKCDLPLDTLSID